MRKSRRNWVLRNRAFCEIGSTKQGVLRNWDLPNRAFDEMWIDEKWTKQFDKMWKNEIGFYQIGVNHKCVSSDLNVLKRIHDEFRPKNINS